MMEQSIRIVRMVQDQNLARKVKVHRVAFEKVVAFLGTVGHVRTKTRGRLHQKDKKVFGKSEVRQFGITRTFDGKHLIFQRW